MTIPKPHPRRKSGFDVVNVWFGCYDAAVDRRIGEPRRVTTPQKQRVQTFFARVKTQWRLTPDELKGAIRFMYSHNPLRVADLADYGDVELLFQVIPHFKRWQSHNKDLIDSIGLPRAITKTIERRSEVDDYLAGLMDEVFEGINS